ncbi:glutamate synthase (NADPH/NADH) small chain [Dongia mobilis]|uniref:Glutamate synthase (NADPH/NADH) small chain n=1 Tax=Dongia mobilis TaxID=578943 RepID=A0A4R6WMA0_9PROT|nr:NAD(P)-dependent oxidoreductase [Dongia mobilis]TDQ82119.1 glutamate synthase (NADPH/NADH) small chain [Dongia mobilis]
MAEKLLKFVSLGRAMPDKRPAEERTRDFAEIYADFAARAAQGQASRCSQCGVPFCQVHCPLNNNIPDWLKLTAEGRLEEAYEISAATNTFPEICGRICPQDRLCEGNCVIEQSGHGTVTIGAIERHVTDNAFAQGWVKPVRPVRELPQSVGIIGAGPAGLAAGEALRRQGYQVTIYDRHDRVGGLLIYGIPNFKLEKQVVQRREQLLRDGGIKFELNFEVGRDASLDQLRQRHDAVLIATGVYKARDLGGPGSGAKGIVPALSYLTAANRHGLGDQVAEFESGELNARDKHVVVIGGGDTAMDCVRTAVRQGAKSVKCLYRRDRANMPGSQRETRNAEEEGVEFIWQSAPSAFLDDGAGRVRAVRAERIHLGLPDATGRQTPRVIEGSAFDLEADLVVKALGFEPEDLPQRLKAPALSVTKTNTIRVNWRSLSTTIPGVFAAGDIVRGASLVVWAIRDGRDAAAAIDTYLQENARKAAAE